MLAGRAPLLLHGNHSFRLPSPSNLATASASPNGKQFFFFLGLLPPGRLPVPTQPVAPSLPPAMLVDIVRVGGHAGRAHPFTAPRTPPCPSGQVE